MTRHAAFTGFEMLRKAKSISVIRRAWLCSGMRPARGDNRLPARGTLLSDELSGESNTESDVRSTDGRVRLLVRLFGGDSFFMLQISSDQFR